jgi:hypothetical protein
VNGFGRPAIDVRGLVARRAGAVADSGIEVLFSMAQASLSGRWFDRANLRWMPLLFPGFSSWLEL